jgi:hypothetical protein
MPKNSRALSVAIPCRRPLVVSTVKAAGSGAALDDVDDGSDDDMDDDMDDVEEGTIPDEPMVADPPWPELADVTDADEVTAAVEVTPVPVPDVLDVLDAGVEEPVHETTAKSPTASKAVAAPRADGRLPKVVRGVRMVNRYPDIGPTTRAFGRTRTADATQDGELRHRPGAGPARGQSFESLSARPGAEARRNRRSARTSTDGPSWS